MGLSITAWSPFYGYLGSLDFETADLFRRQNDVGFGSLTGVRGVDPVLLTRDSLLVASYAEDGVDLDRSLWLVRRRTRVIRGRTTTTGLLVVDPNHLLKRRIIAYASESAQALKTGVASALMVDFVRQQFTTATDTTRNAPLTVPDSVAGGSSQSVAAAHDTLLDVLNKIAAAELLRGLWLGFGIAPSNLDGLGIDGLGLTFTVSADQTGVDRRGELSLSSAAGSLQQLTIEDDWSDEATRVYVGGAGQKAARLVATETRDDVANLGPYGLIEDWIDATNISTMTYLQTKAEAELQERVARTRYKAPIAFGADLRWGRDLGFGDRMYVDVDNLLVEGRITEYGISADADKGTVVDATVEGYI